VTTPEIIDEINKLILEDQWISAKLTAEQLGISHEQAGSIIHEDLGVDALHEVGPEIPERISKTSTLPVV